MLNGFNNVHRGNVRPNIGACASNLAEDDNVNRWHFEYENVSAAGATTAINTTSTCANSSTNIIAISISADDCTTHARTAATDPESRATATEICEKHYNRYMHQCISMSGVSQQLYNINGKLSSNALSLLSKSDIDALEASPPSNPCLSTNATNDQTNSYQSTTLNNSRIVNVAETKTKTKTNANANANANTNANKIINHNNNNRNNTNNKPSTNDINLESYPSAEQANRNIEQSGYAETIDDRRHRHMNSSGPRRQNSLSNVFSKIIDGMPAGAMFAKLKNVNPITGTTANPVDSNPIRQQFDIGKQVASAGPEFVWRIHDAYRKSDGKVREWRG